MRLEEVVEVLAIDRASGSKPTFDEQSRLLDPMDIFTICSSMVTLEDVYSSDQCGPTSKSTILVRLAHSSVRVRASGLLTLAFFLLLSSTADIFQSQNGFHVDKVICIWGC